MDPFEEFEFKPLTEGLGFHKKQPKAAQNELSSTEPSPVVKGQGLELIEETNPLTPPLPRKPRTSKPLPEAPGGLTEVGGDGSGTAVDEILKTLQKNRRFDFENSKVQTPAAQEHYKDSTWSVAAVFLDAMLVVAASLLCMIILLVVTKVDLIGNITNPDSEGMIYASLAATFAGVTFIYLTMNRLYLGFTPGEWAFDQRVGKPEELNKASYSLRVVARALLIVGTGIITLPLLSWLTGKDIAGYITGASLYKKV